MTWRFDWSYRNAGQWSLSPGNIVRIVFSSMVMVVSAFCSDWAFAAGEQPSGAAAASSTSGAQHADDELAIRTHSANYALAFTKGDVAALAGMWAEDAVYTDENGTVSRGREAIRNQIADFFKNYGKQPLEVSVLSIEFPSDTTAIEHGVTKLISAQPPGNAQNYTAVHVKRNGTWQMVSVTESPYKAQSKTELKDLSWLIGSWNVKGPAGHLHLKSDWVADGKIICLTFETSEKDGSKTSQTEYIFWNPLRNRLCSWQFDWSGGYGTAWWEKSGSDWIGHAISVEPDGRLARANYVIRRVDDNTFSWQSTGRQLSGQRLPDTVKLLVKRDGV